MVKLANAREPFTSLRSSAHRFLSSADPESRGSLRPCRAAPRFFFFFFFFFFFEQGAESEVSALPSVPLFLAMGPLRSAGSAQVHVSSAPTSWRLKDCPRSQVPQYSYDRPSSGSPVAAVLNLRPRCANLHLVLDLEKEKPPESVAFRRSTAELRSPVSENDVS